MSASLMETSKIARTVVHHNAPVFKKAPVYDVVRAGVDGRQGVRRGSKRRGERVPRRRVDAIALYIKEITDNAEIFTA